MNLKKKIAALAVATGIIGASGVAYAYWTTTGSGTGSATAASENGTVGLSATFDNDIAPGQSRLVTFSGANTNDTDLWVGTIHPVVSTSSAQCLASDFRIADVDSNRVVGAHASAVALGTSTLYFDNTAANQDACKSATITLTLTSN